MPSAGKAGIGLGTSIAGGAASGAAFGPIGAGIGAGVGGLLGLWGALSDSDAEEQLRRQQQLAKKQALVSALRNNAARLGGFTNRADMAAQMRGIDSQYQAGMDQLNQVGPQDIMGLASNLANVGGKVKGWMGDPNAGAQGPLMRNSDLYGAPDTRTGLTYAQDAGVNTMDDPMAASSRSYYEDLRRRP